MAFSRLPMRKILEVLRLHHEGRRSHREIARAVVASPTTVGEILRRAKLAGIGVGKPETFTNQLDDILSNASIFGTDLTKTVLADKIKAYFKAELAGPGAVRKTLHDAVNA